MGEKSEFILSLSLKDKMLLSLLAAGATVETIIDELYTPYPSSSSVGNFNGYSFKCSPYYRRQVTQLRQELSRMVKKKWIAFKGDWGDRQYYLEEKGLNQLFATFPTLKYNRSEWDGFWRVVIYDIKESESRLRFRLREQLKRLGFIFIQKSVWITPFPIEVELKKFLKKNGLWGKIIVFNAKLPLEESQGFLKLFGRGPKIKGEISSDINKPIKALFKFKFR